MRSILFVDDDAHLLNGLRRALRPHNHEWNMRFAEGGAEALTSLYARPADVVVSDFRMPGMDGAELLSLVRQRWPDSVRLILSGHTDEKDIARVTNLAHQFISKPCETEELVGVLDRAMRIHEQLDGERIRQEVTRIGNLPSVPRTLRMVMAAVDSGDSDGRSLARLIEADVGLSTKVLQLANSSFIAPRVRTTSVEGAVVRLGLKTIRAMALLENVNRVLPVPAAIGPDWLSGLNELSYRTAGLARRLAAPGQAEDAFCAALLAECGQLVLATCRPTEFAEILLTRSHDCRSLADLERERIGVTHGQVGAYLLSLWAFPMDIVDAVTNHDRPLEAGESGSSGICAAVRSAHSIAAWQQPGSCPAAPPEDPAEQLPDGPARVAVARWRVELAEAEAAGAR